MSEDAAKYNGSYPSMTCPTCGGTLIGDGYNTVLHCEFAEWDDYAYLAPDEEVVYCVDNNE
jgi:hypothetical protein